MTCSGCATTVKKSLSSVADVEKVEIDLAAGKAEIAMSHHVPVEQFQKSLNGHYEISEWNNNHGSHSIRPVNPVNSESADRFWADRTIWKNASFNTLNCLIGCSIGDFVMVIFLQNFYPNTAMATQMILATLAGLITSVSMETILLKTKEKFNWGLALQTALSMSFISMIAMELVMNATDFMITGGKAAFGNPMYWIALLVAMSTGFLAPLPYED